MMPARIGESMTSSTYRADRSMSLDMRRRMHSFLGPAGHLRPGHDAGCRDRRSERQLGSATRDASSSSDSDWLKTFRNSTSSIQRTSNGLSAISTAGSTNSTRRSRPSISRQLRRYHNWLDSLPETKQDELKEKPPGERMELIKKLVKDHPVSRASTARFLQFVDVGDYSPFELAAIYQIWQSMSRSRATTGRENATRTSPQEFLRQGRGEADRSGTQSGRNSTRPSGYAISRLSPRITRSHSCSRN